MVRPETWAFVQRIGKSWLRLHSDCSGDDARTKVYDHVIIGFGTSGKAACTELAAKGAGSTLIIDPRINLGGDQSLGADRIQGSAIGIDVVGKTVDLSNRKRFHYKTLLIATGLYSLTEPAVPFSCLDPELLKQPNYGMIDPATPSAMNELISLVTAGKHVTILGGDQWAAVSVAISLAAAARQAGFTRSVTLLSSQPGILTQQLPRYLSVALSKRLSSRRQHGGGIEFVPYGIVKFIGGPEVLANIGLNESGGGNVIFIANSNDSMETSYFVTDRVVAFPRLSLPSQRGPRASGSNGHFATAALEAGEQGGLVVNASLSAVDSIFVAGDAANLHIPPIGRGVWTGFDHAIATGSAAARAMLRAVNSGGPRGTTWGQVSSDGTYSNLPAYYCLGGGDLGVNLLFVGHCSHALDTHGFWWRVSGSDSASASKAASASASASVSSSTKSPTGTSATEILTEAMRTWWWGSDSYGGGSGQGSTSEVSSRVKAKGRAGLSRVAATVLVPSVNGSSSSSSSSSSSGQKALPPLGLGVVLYVDHDRVVGVCISGLPQPSQASAQVLALAKKALGADLVGINVRSDESATALVSAQAESVAPANRGEDESVGQGVREGRAGGAGGAGGSVSYDLGGGDRWDPQWEVVRLRRQQAMLSLAQSLAAPACGLSHNRPEGMPRPQYRFAARSNVGGGFVGGLGLGLGGGSGGGGGGGREGSSGNAAGPRVPEERIATGGIEVTPRQRIAAAYARGIRGGGGGVGPSQATH